MVAWYGMLSQSQHLNVLAACMRLHVTNHIRQMIESKHPRYRNKITIDLQGDWQTCPSAADRFWCDLHKPSFNNAGARQENISTSTPLLRCISESFSRSVHAYPSNPVAESGLRSRPLCIENKAASCLNLDLAAPV